MSTNVNSGLLRTEHLTNDETVIETNVFDRIHTFSLHWRSQLFSWLNNSTWNNCLCLCLLQKHISPVSMHKHRLEHVCQHVLYLVHVLFQLLPFGHERLKPITGSLVTCFLSLCFVLPLGVVQVHRHSKCHIHQSSHQFHSYRLQTTNHVISSQIWCSHNDLVEDPGLLRCDKLPLAEWFLTLQTNTVPLSSNIK